MPIEIQFLLGVIDFHFEIVEEVGVGFRLNLIPNEHQTRASITQLRSHQECLQIIRARFVGPTNIIRPEQWDTVLDDIMRAIANGRHNITVSLAPLVTSR